TRRTAPFPIDFSELELPRDIELLWIDIRLYCMGYNDFSGQASFLLVVQSADLIATVLVSELVDNLRNCQGELSEEPQRPHLSVVINIVFAKAGVVTMDNVFVILINQHYSRAKDNQIKVCYRNRIIKVRFLKD